MQTLAKYLFGLLLIIFASLTNEEPAKEEVAEKCTQYKVETSYARNSNNEMENYI